MPQTAVGRELLYVNTQDSAGNCLNVLRRAGWTPVPVPLSPQAVGDALDRRDIPVGIVHVDGASDVLRLQDLQEPMQSRATEWIAVIPRDLVGNGTVQRLVAECCFDFHTLPLDAMRMLDSLGHAHGMARLRRQALEPQPQSSAASEQMVGASPAMLRLFKAIRKVAFTEVSVLIAGESGTGKELTARAIHEHSGRSGGPFVAINCGAIPATLIQSELFGFEKGAFTGAVQRRIGKLEAAHGGTVFLDEIGDLPLELQSNLLRFLQERQVDRVGGHEPIPIDVRVLAATHVDLGQAVEQGRFREDLYHRLNVVRLEMPALRERGEDIEILARYFFEQFCHPRRRSLRGFSRASVAAMLSYPWPGNVRELINRVRRAAVMSEGRLISPEDLGLAAPGEGAPAVLTLDEVRRHAEREAVQAALNRNAHNLARAARELGISRVTLYRLLERHALN